MYCEKTIEIQTSLLSAV